MTRYEGATHMTITTAQTIVPAVSIGHGCGDCYRLTAEPEYLNTAGPHYLPAVTFTASHGALREGAGGTTVDAGGEPVKAISVALDDLPTLIASLQGYVDAQHAAGDAMVDGWAVR